MWGNAKYHLGNYEGAIKDYTAAIQLKPDFAEAYVNRGNAKNKLGRTSEAEQDFNTALPLAIELGDANLKTAIEEALRILDE